MQFLHTKTESGMTPTDQSNLHTILDVTGLSETIDRLIGKDDNDTCWYWVGGTSDVVTLGKKTTIRDY